MRGQSGVMYQLQEDYYTERNNPAYSHQAGANTYPANQPGGGGAGNGGAHYDDGSGQYSSYAAHTGHAQRQNSRDSDLYGNNGDDDEDVDNVHVHNDEGGIDQVGDGQSDDDDDDDNNMQIQNGDDEDEDDDDDVDVVGVNPDHQQRLDAV